MLKKNIFVNLKKNKKGKWEMNEIVGDLKKEKKKKKKKSLYCSALRGLKAVGEGLADGNPLG